MEIPAGSVDQSISFRAMTSSGAALTGKVAADFTFWYRRTGLIIPVSLSDLSAVDDPHSDGGLYEEGEGWYRLDVPDAAIADGVNNVSIGGTVDGGVVLTSPITLTAIPASGTGAHAGVITVDDGTDPVQSARVYARLNGILKAYGVTDVDGEIDAFRLDPGTYDIAILAEGHLSFASDGGLVVGGDDWSDEYSLTSVTPLVPDNPDAGVISVLCVDGAGNTQEGINVYYKLAEEPSGDTGYAYDGDVLSATSDADGIAELTVVRLGVYLVKRGDTKAWRQITADDAATSTTISFVGT